MAQWFRHGVCAFSSEKPTASNDFLLKRPKTPMGESNNDPLRRVGTLNSRGRCHGTAGGYLGKIGLTGAIGSDCAAASDVPGAFHPCCPGLGATAHAPLQTS